MKKTIFLVLSALLLLLLGCRTENLLETESANQKNSQGKITSRKIYPDEFQLISGINKKFENSENILNQRLSTGKAILEGAIIDSAYAMETTDNNVISYTFPVYRQNQSDYFENFVLQKKIGEQNFKSYLYKYKRVGVSGYDPENIEIYDIDAIPQDVNGKMLYTTISTIDGCTEIQITSVDCGEGGNHTNGALCPSLDYHVPYDYITTFNNCPSSGGGGGGSNTGSNGNPPTGSQPNYGVTIPVPDYPKWGRCSTRTGAQWDALGLNTAQLTFINSYENKALRGEMTGFLTRNNIYIFDCTFNPAGTVPTDVNSVGTWIVELAMTNPEFLNSEFWSNFVNTDLQFQLWSKSFFEQNPNVTWFQFENWFLTKSEGQDGIYDEAAELAFAQQTFQQHPLPSFAQYELAFPSKPNAKYPDYYRDAQPNYVVYNDYVGGKLKQLFNQNGGNIKGNPYRNTCAVRQSYTLNKLGIMIPFQHEDLTGNNNWNYIMTASQMGIFLEETFGAPTHKLEGADANDKTKIAKFLKGKTGIYLVINNDPSKNNGAGYTGHTDMIKNGYVSGGANYMNEETQQIVRGGIKHFYIWELN